MAERKRKWDQEGSAEAASPLVKPKIEEDIKPTLSPAAAAPVDAAAAIAAKLAAQYDRGAKMAAAVKVEGKEINDPDFVKDIEVNDLRNRYLLTRGSTQHEIQDATGASVTTKGQWYPDKSMATDKDPPLYLHITANSQEELDKAVARVQELIDQDLGPLTERPGFRDRDRERRRWPEAKIEIGLETLRNFNVRAKIVGPGGLFVKFIQAETNAKVQIKGLGSGFVEQDTNVESQEPMHIAIAGPDERQVARAKELAEDLLTVVKEEWNKSKAVLDQYMHQQQAQYNNPVYQYPGQYAAYAQQGYQPPLPAGEAPAPPSGAAPPPPPSDPSAGLNGQPAQPGDAAGQAEYAAYWQQIQSNPQWAAYYQQYAISTVRA
ncbi:uncharacterized protein L969DRAFT_57317 [Mixia osmundae IAM 14324]|uniref:uncharacterized protein n=1 Tax=Mixia osmundae (strain CBS 9802 / IAM 14324 / JCM 22182 / KY 12970) TaxID=764103 RepID=UPI0004A5584F|nr:uncharacterized protein L969DRAFT_57317 [Mixia osmundae IAM 14324]KEI42610.1 hypothetical protein L969DRAFT_57317 [Mixia osmundae IAM 14324]